MTEPSGRRYPELSPFGTGLLGRCPRCGEGALFRGFLTVRPRCSACGLDYAFADPGDGPAVFVTLIGGFAVLGAVLAIDIAYEPPFWIYPVIVLPLGSMFCLALLRALKGFLIASQYHNKAEPGRLAP